MINSNRTRNISKEIFLVHFHTQEKTCIPTTKGQTRNKTEVKEIGYKENSLLSLLMFFLSLLNLRKIQIQSTFAADKIEDEISVIKNHFNISNRVGLA